MRPGASFLLSSSSPAAPSLWQWLVRFSRQAFQSIASLTRVHTLGHAFFFVLLVPCRDPHVLFFCYSFSTFHRNVSQTRPIFLFVRALLSLLYFSATLCPPHRFPHDSSAPSSNSSDLESRSHPSVIPSLWSLPCLLYLEVPVRPKPNKPSASARPSCFALSFHCHFLKLLPLDPSFA